jgi:hypothetical protein
MDDKSIQELLDELVFLLKYDKASPTTYTIIDKKKFWKVINKIGELQDEHEELATWGKDY